MLKAFVDAYPHHTSISLLVASCVISSKFIGKYYLFRCLLLLNRKYFKKVKKKLAISCLGFDRLSPLHAYKHSHALTIAIVMYNEKKMFSRRAEKKNLNKKEILVGNGAFVLFIFFLSIIGIDYVPNKGWISVFILLFVKCSSLRTNRRLHSSLTLAAFQYVLIMSTYYLINIGPVQNMIHRYNMLVRNFHSGSWTMHWRVYLPIGLSHPLSFSLSPPFSLSHSLSLPFSLSLSLSPTPNPLTPSLALIYCAWMYTTREIIIYIVQRPYRQSIYFVPA